MVIYGGRRPGEYDDILKGRVSGRNTKAWEIKEPDDFRPWYFRKERQVAMYTRITRRKMFWFAAFVTFGGWSYLTALPSKIFGGVGTTSVGHQYQFANMKPVKHSPKTQTQRDNAYTMFNHALNSKHVPNETKTRMGSTLVDPKSGMADRIRRSHENSGSSKPSRPPSKPKSPSRPPQE